MRSRIVAAGRMRLASSCLRTCTIADVATTAEVDPKTVTYYFADLQQLLDAALEPPEQVRAAVAGIRAAPATSRGRVIVDALIALWSDASTQDYLRLVTAISRQPAAWPEELTQSHRETVGAILVDGLDDRDAALRGELVLAQLTALSTLMCVRSVEPATSPADRALVGLYATVIDQVLTLDLSGARA